MAYVCVFEPPAAERSPATPWNTRVFFSRSVKPFFDHLLVSPGALTNSRP